MTGYLRQMTDGVVVNVHVVPRAKKSQFAGFYADSIRIRLKAPPVEGKANKALIEFLAEQFGVPRMSVEIEGGLSSRQKRVRLRGVSLEQIERVVKDLAE